MATALTVPLDDWVMANSRPMKTESVNDLRVLGSRRDYSTLTVEEAFSLLYHTCKARFGDLKPLDFDVKELGGPLSYSSTLTVTGPDEIGIEFPNSGKHPTAIMAKMHAAYQAVQQGVIAFLMQGQASPAPVPQAFTNITEIKKSPSKGNTLDLNPNLQQPLPQKPNLGPSSVSTSGLKPKNIPVYDGPNPKPVASPAKPPPKAPTSVDKSPVSIINELLQKVYSAKKLHKQANNGLKWEQKKYPEGYLARMTVILPSGAKKSYGLVPETLSESFRKSKYPLKPESMPNVAKRSVASYAIKLGVLDFIADEDVSGRALASVTLPVQSASGLPPRPTPASGSKQPKLNVPSVQAVPGAQPNKQTSKLLSSSILPNDQAQPSSSTRATSNPSDQIPTAPKAQPTHESPEPGEIAAGASPKIGNETFKADVESRYWTRERLGSYEPLGEDDEQSQSESMELDSDARADSVLSNSGSKVSPELEADRLEEEPPKKRMKTEPLASEKSPSPKAEVKESKIMHGPSYAYILSAYCIENAFPQPQVTYQRQLGEPDKEDPVLYHVSIVIGTRRYELSKHYESVQNAEEKLSKRILKLFAIQPKKA